MKTKKAGFDIHGVLDQSPEKFKNIINVLKHSGWEIHILTGHELGRALNKELSDLGIYYDQLFSITSYHKKIGTVVKYLDKSKKNPIISQDLWERSKGDYAKRSDLTIHVDDSNTYGKYFPRETRYVLYRPKKFFNTWRSIYGIRF